ncbi:uncharacterized protein BYT42DRAFT_558921 [Radiomyces spectabilis]|uniref:uncharacterized protein n=1 Tax=Radiomyces spectabilis TaxID=64574 RepID=UPI00221E811F|nr:uncharacterized protein BYT42DRAFT_558921 [Radiomyces spectabilis]KAI8388100.1 hypothetical protein BYT42DRAFT_558921 [Radiomyces spectabilis]
MEAEEENLRKQTLAAKQEYQRYKYQHLQLDRFIANIFQEATNVENYPELTALTAKIEQENQAKSRCQPEHHQAERKRRDISSAIQSLEKASKALAFGIDAPTLLDTFSNRDDYRDSVKSAKRHVESAVHLLKTQGDPEADSLKVVLDSMMLRKDTFWDEQSERNQKRRAQLQLWEAQIRGTLKGLQINLLAPLTKKVNDLKRRIKNYDDILMALKDDILEKQQQILDDILSDIPVYQPAGGPPPYVPEPATSTA